MEHRLDDRRVAIGYLHVEFKCAVGEAQSCLMKGNKIGDSEGSGSASYRAMSYWTPS